MRGIQEVKKTPFSPCLSFTVPRLDPEVRLRRPRHSQGDSKKLSNGRAPGAQSSPPPADDDDAQVDGPSEDGAAEHRQQPHHERVEGRLSDMCH